MKYNKPEHLLYTLGVLSNFSICKIIKKSELDNIKNEINLKHSDKLNDVGFINGLVIHELQESAKRYITKITPPGFIISEQYNDQLKLQTLYENLTSIVHDLLKSFTKNNLNKQDLCFIINAIVGLREITQTDFEKFHKNFDEYIENNNSEDEDDDEDDDDDDDDDDVTGDDVT